MRMASSTAVCLLLLAVFSAAMAANHTVEWSPEGVANIEYKLTVMPGDFLTFRCPRLAFSFIMYMVSEQQYTNCNCSLSTCLLLANCLYTKPNTFDLAFQRNSADIADAVDFKPGTTYYFASFSEDVTSLSSVPPPKTGGECAKSPGLRLMVEVLAVNTDGPVDPTTSSITPTEKPTEVDKGSGDGEDPIKPDDGGENEPVVSVDGLTPSSSPSLLTSRLTLLVLATQLLAWLAS